MRAGPLRGGVMGAAVACGGMVREKDQKGRCEEEEQIGTRQCPQDVMAALLATGPNVRRVPAGGAGRRRRGGGGGEGRLVRGRMVQILEVVYFGTEGGRVC